MTEYEGGLSFRHTPKGFYYLLIVLASIGGGDHGYVRRPGDAEDQEGFSLCVLPSLCLFCSSCWSFESIRVGLEIVRCLLRLLLLFAVQNVSKKRNIEGVRLFEVVGSTCVKETIPWCRRVSNFACALAVGFGWALVVRPLQEINFWREFWI